MIRIYKNWVIDSDDSQYKIGEVKKRINKDTGLEEEYFIADYFLTTIQGCIKKILEIEQRRMVKSKEIELKDVIKELKVLQKDFDDILKNALENA